MNTLSKWALGIIAVGAIVAIAVTMNNKQTELASSIRIGVMMPLTGDGAAYGVPINNAFILAKDEINAAGGIDGKQLEFITEDSKCSAAGGAAVAQKLANVDKVKIIFGGGCSSETLAAAPIVEEARVLLISPDASSPDITKAGDYIFRTTPSDAGQGAGGAEFSYRNLNVRNAAVISEQTDYAQALKRVFVNRFKELGGNVAVDEVFQTDDVDLRAQLLKVKGSVAELVYIVPQTGAKAELIVQQMKSLEVNAKIFGTETTLGRDLIAKNPSLFAGMYGTEPFFDSRNQEAEKFLQKYETRFNEKAPYPAYMANAYAQTYLLKEGIERIGTDPEKLKNWLYSVKGWKSAAGEFSFTQDGDVIGQFAIKHVQADGSLKELGIVKAP
jgi:branched-chain amino acid transport system substrate-binding protein